MLLKNHRAKAFEDKYLGGYRVVDFLGANQVQLKDSKGLLTKAHITHIKKANMVDTLLEQLPDLQKFGRVTKLNINPDDIKHLGWELPTDVNPGYKRLKEYLEWEKVQELSQVNNIQVEGEEHTTISVKTETVIKETYTEMDSDNANTSNCTISGGVSDKQVQAQPQAVSPTTPVKDTKHVQDKSVQPTIGVETEETWKNILQTLQKAFNVIYNHGTLDHID